MPFPLLGFDCENGGEFLNHHLLAYRHKPKRQLAYQSLMDDGAVDRQGGRELCEHCESLESFALRAELERGLNPILASAVDHRRHPAGGSSAPSRLRSTARRV